MRPWLVRLELLDRGVAELAPGAAHGDRHRHVREQDGVAHRRHGGRALGLHCRSSGPWLHDHSRNRSLGPPAVSTAPLHKQCATKSRRVLWQSMARTVARSQRVWGRCNAA